MLYNFYLECGPIEYSKARVQWPNKLHLCLTGHRVEMPQKLNLTSILLILFCSILFPLLFFRYYIRFEPTSTGSRGKPPSDCTFCHRRSILHLPPLSQFLEFTRSFDFRAEKARLFSRLWRNAFWHSHSRPRFTFASNLQFSLQLFPLLCHVGTI